MEGKLRRAPSDVRSLPQYANSRTETIIKDNKVLNLFYQDVTVPLSAKDVARELCIPTDAAKGSIHRINKSIKVLKVVGTYETIGGNIAPKYQVMQSPLKEIEVVSNPINYSTINRFMSEYLTLNKSFMKNLEYPVYLLRKYIERELKQRNVKAVIEKSKSTFARAYPISLLQEIAQNFEKSFTQPLTGIMEPQVSKKVPLFTIFKNFFKKKGGQEENYDIIQF